MTRKQQKTNKKRNQKNKHERKWRSGWSKVDEEAGDRKEAKKKKKNTSNREDNSKEREKSGVMAVRHLRFSGLWWKFTSALKMEALCSSETLAVFVHRLQGSQMECPPAAGCGVLVCRLLRGAAVGLTISVVSGVYDWTVSVPFWAVAGPVSRGRNKLCSQKYIGIFMCLQELRCGNEFFVFITRLIGNVVSGNCRTADRRDCWRRDRIVLRTGHTADWSWTN